MCHLPGASALNARIMAEASMLLTQELADAMEDFSYLSASASPDGAVDDAVAHRVAAVALLFRQAHQNLLTEEPHLPTAQ